MGSERRPGLSSMGSSMGDTFPFSSSILVSTINNMYELESLALLCKEMGRKEKS